MKTALLITPKSQIVPAMENVDYIGVDAGALLIEEAGYPCLLAIGDFDSMDADALKALKERMEVIQHPVKKNETDSELAIRLCKERGYTSIILWGGLSNRLDHTLLNIQLLKHNPDLVVLQDEKQKVSILQKGEHILKNAYRHISFFPLEESILTLEGLLYPLNHRLIEVSDLYLTSNSFVEKEAHVLVEKGSLLCVESNYQ